MRLTTWNINSVRLRLDLLARLVQEASPDIICLQETKVMDALFPRKAIAELGYPHQHISGMKSYNGVAILSRQPFTHSGKINWVGRDDCRHIHVTVKDGPHIHCCYVPAGGDIPDPIANPKFAHKLAFIEEQRAFWSEQKQASQGAILVGDLNIAPLEQDVWSHKQMIDIVSHTPVEIEGLLAWQKSYGWVDVARHFTPANQKLYSWWSYRAADWALSDRGRRLDHIWVTPNLTPALKGCSTLRDARGWEPKPSDHVPVIMDIDL